MRLWLFMDFSNDMHALFLARIVVVFWINIVNGHEWQCGRLSSSIIRQGKALSGVATL